MQDDNLTAAALEVAVSIGQKLAAPQTQEKVHYAVIPNDCTVKSLKEFQFPNGMTPDRIIADVNLRDSGSFARYVSAYTDPRTRVFAEPTQFKFLAVLDYHAAGEFAPQFCSHKAALTLQQDDRWKVWLSMDNKPMAQADFAEFIEDNRADISDPSPARMLEIASDLTAHSEVNFGASTKLSNGQTSLRYEEVVKAGVGQAGAIEVPEEFSIQVPVFYGESAISIRARLRFRINQSKLTFHYKLYRPGEVQRAAFQSAVKAMNDELKTDILMGSPA